MKNIIWLLVLLNTFHSYANDTHAVDKNAIKLVSMKCADTNPDTSEDSMDTTPQSPPLSTDDPETIDCHSWEVNVVVDGDIAKSAKSYELPLVDITYGLGNNLDISFATPYVVNNADGASTSNMGASEASIKWMFYRDEERGLNMAINPGVEFNSGNGTTVSAPLLISKKVGETANGDIMVTASAAYNTNLGNNQSDSVSAGAGVGIAVSKNTAIMAGVDIDRAINADPLGVRDQVVRVKVGFLHSLGKKFSIFGSIGQSVSSSDGQTHKYFLFGLKRTFGK